MIYLSVVIICLGIFTLFLLRRNITKTGKNRIAFLKGRQSISPVSTESPVDSPVADFRKKGVENIEKRFSVIKDSITVIVVIFIVVAALIPLLKGASVTVISVLTGALAVIIGITAKPFIENFVSGVILGLNKTIKVGDTILLDDHYGTVEDITLTSTIIKLWDWRRIIIPNVLMLGKEVISYSFQDNFIWTKIEFWVSYEANLQQVKQIAIQSAKSSPYFAPHEEPAFWVMELDKNSYRCWLAAWSDSPAQAWELGNEVRTMLITEFQRLQIQSHGFIVDLKQKLDG